MEKKLSMGQTFTSYIRELHLNITCDNESDGWIGKGSFFLIELSKK